MLKQLKQEAKELGRKAFQQGKRGVPVLDSAFMSFLNENNEALKENNKAGLKVLPLLNAWHSGWHRGQYEATAKIPW
jgi:hypothetical protein